MEHMPDMALDVSTRKLGFKGESLAAIAAISQQLSSLRKDGDKSEAAFAACAIFIGTRQAPQPRRADDGSALMLQPSLVTILSTLGVGLVSFVEHLSIAVELLRMENLRETVARLRDSVVVAKVTYERYRRLWEQLTTNLARRKEDALPMPQPQRDLGWLLYLECLRRESGSRTASSSPPPRHLALWSPSPADFARCQEVMLATLAFLAPWTGSVQAGGQHSSRSSHAMQLQQSNAAAGLGETGVPGAMPGEYGMASLPRFANSPPGTAAAALMTTSPSPCASASAALPVDVGVGGGSSGGSGIGGTSGSPESMHDPFSTSGTASPAAIADDYDELAAAAAAAAGAAAAASAASAGGGSSGSGSDSFISAVHASAAAAVFAAFGKSEPLPSPLAARPSELASGGAAANHCDYRATWSSADTTAAAAAAAEHAVAAPDGPDGSPATYGQSMSTKIGSSDAAVAAADEAVLRVSRLARASQQAAAVAAHIPSVAAAARALSLVEEGTLRSLRPPADTPLGGGAVAAAAVARPPSPSVSPAAWMWLDDAVVADIVMKLRTGYRASLEREAVAAAAAAAAGNEDGNSSSLLYGVDVDVDGVLVMDEANAATATAEAAAWLGTDTAAAASAAAAALAGFARPRQQQEQHAADTAGGGAEVGFNRIANSAGKLTRPSLPLSQPPRTTLPALLVDSKVAGAGLSVSVLASQRSGKRCSGITDVADEARGKSSVITRASSRVGGKGKGKARTGATGGGDCGSGQEIGFDGRVGGDGRSDADDYAAEAVRDAKEGMKLKEAAGAEVAAASGLGSASGALNDSSPTSSLAITSSKDEDGLAMMLRWISRLDKLPAEPSASLKKFAARCSGGPSGSESEDPLQEISRRLDELLGRICICGGALPGESPLFGSQPPNGCGGFGDGDYGGASSSQSSRYDHSNPSQSDTYEHGGTDAATSQREVRSRTRALYWQTLEALVASEAQRLHATPSHNRKHDPGDDPKHESLKVGGGEGVDGRRMLLSLLRADAFHRALLGCCLEVVAKGMSLLSLTLPFALDRFQLQALDMSSAMDAFVGSCPNLPLRLARHMAQVRRDLLGRWVWRRGSNVFSLAARRRSLADANARAAAAAAASGRSTSGASAAMAAAAAGWPPPGLWPAPSLLPRPPLVALPQSSLVLALEQQQQHLPEDKTGEDIKSDTVPTREQRGGSRKRLAAADNELWREEQPHRQRAKPSTGAVAATIDVDPVMSVSAASAGGRPRSPDELSLDVMFRGVAALASARVSTLCLRCLNLDPAVVDQVWAVVRHVLSTEHLVLLENRHIDHIIMCSTYAICKMAGKHAAAKAPPKPFAGKRQLPVVGSSDHGGREEGGEAEGKEVTFKRIVAEYRNSAASNDNVGGTSWRQTQKQHQHRQSQLQLHEGGAKDGGEGEAGEERAARRDVVSFYNTEFMPQLKSFLLEFRDLPGQRRAIAAVKTLDDARRVAQASSDTSDMRPPPPMQALAEAAAAASAAAAAGAGEDAATSQTAAPTLQAILGGNGIADMDVVGVSTPPLGILPFGIIQRGAPLLLPPLALADQAALSLRESLPHQVGSTPRKVGGSGDRDIFVRTVETPVRGGAAGGGSLVVVGAMQKPPPAMRGARAEYTFGESPSRNLRNISRAFTEQRDSNTDSNNSIFGTSGSGSRAKRHSSPGAIRAAGAAKRER